MDTVTWLHLSDFHFRTGEQHTWDENIILQALLTDLKERIEQDGLRPDIVVVTGDIAFSGQPAEYDLARSFLDQLLPIADLGPDRLFLVPGNHDVDRKSISTLSAAATSVLTSRRQVNSLLDTPQDLGLVLERFRHYRDFVNSYCQEQQPFGAEHCSYTRILDLAGVRVAILGLNSAWLAASDQDRNRLLLGERQVRQSLAAAKEADLRLALMHHPFDWLQDFDRQDVVPLLSGGCDFVLHGHMHQVGLLQTLTPDTKTMIIAAGACYDTRDLLERPNTYSLVQLNLDDDQGTIHLRLYSDRQGGFWTKDVLNYRNAPDGQHTFPLSARSVPLTSEAQGRAALSWQHLRSYLPLGQGSKVFISYKRNTEPDDPLAQFLVDSLEEAGHRVFIDKRLKVGVDWAREIQRQIQTSDFMIVLLSEAAVDSEMVVKEVEYAQRHGTRPLPVRVGTIVELPYQLDNYLGHLQYALWQASDDNEQLLKQLLEAINAAQELPLSAAEAQPTEVELAAPEEGVFLAPRPYADPRFVESLRDPSGALGLRSGFYVRRDGDRLLERELAKPYGTTNTIRASRQAGKSSLLVRAVAQARQQGSRVVFVDLQPISDQYVRSLDAFLYYLSCRVVSSLGLEQEQVERAWRGGLGAPDKMTTLMETYILSQTGAQIVLALDEADRLLSTDYSDTFFGLLRSWHNSRALNSLWENLDIVMVISTEPHLLIEDGTQSPFNVGTKIRLKDLSEEQVRELNESYRQPLDEGDFASFMGFLSGHPYLTNKALYLMVSETWSWQDMRKVASTEESPFGDHLRNYLWLLQDRKHLLQALKQVVAKGRCLDQTSYYRLSQAGLIKGPSKDSCTFRCQLYEIYLKDRL